jgi:hypothetical protein
LLFLLQIVQNQLIKSITHVNLEAQITSIACSDAPAGSSRWTLSLINEKIVELNYVETISNESIRKVLKKVSSNLG